MKISYNWLKQYIDTDLSPEKIAEILTATGLEVEGVEKIESVKGGLRGLVIGEVLEKWSHPNADRLNVTKVNVGGGDPLQIVCGAPNVDAGQKVVVATIGAEIHPTEGDPFKIKKGKIRGEESWGMICAEDEIGLGESHDGIMVLDPEAKPGTAASEFFQVEDDYQIEIGLTPNRADGFSHIGVARDLKAALKNMRGIEGNPNAEVKWPDVDSFSIDGDLLPINVEVENKEAAPRYAGVTIRDVKVEASPDWLQNRLRSIGLSPINNVVDVTNFVLHELGQPLHAFDYAAIKGEKVIVKTLADKTKFTTLDEEERELSDQDLMICNAEGGMCIAGVFGGINSGVTEDTKNIFLESALFDPVYIRKTAKRHGLSTDASFRFERGVDPEITIYALKRAANLICDIAGGKVASDIIDIQSQPAAAFEVVVNPDRIRKLIGKEIEDETMEQILADLDIVIEDRAPDQWKLAVPPYRVDVKREADVVEEILRIYGFNNVEIPQYMRTSLSYAPKPDPEKITDRVADFLTSRGFVEAMSNSLTKSSYAEELNAGGITPEKAVKILNPLSQDLGVMRQSMVFQLLEAVELNQNFRNADLKMYEFGRIYQKKGDRKYSESQRLALVMTGKKYPESWNNPDEDLQFADLKGSVDRLFDRLGFSKALQTSGADLPFLEDGLQYSIHKKPLAQLGWVNGEWMKKFSLKNPVFYAEIDWDVVIEKSVINKVKASVLPRYQEVRRDLSLLLDKAVSFQNIVDIAGKQEKKLLRDVNLFDVYEGKNLEEGKKSYAVSFILRDDEKTLKDKQIDKVMQKITDALQKQLGASLR
ncbi:phenylalanine--tRNA ligase subunit beta [Halocola ammonii]